MTAGSAGTGGGDRRRQSPGRRASDAPGDRAGEVRGDRARGDRGDRAGDPRGDRARDDRDDRDPAATTTGRLRAVPRELADRSRDTLRLLKPDSAADIDRRLGTPPAPRQIRGATGILGVLDRFQRRHTVAGFPLAVIYKFADDQGVYFAAMLAYYGFVSLFPLLLLFVSISGFVLAGDPSLQTKLLNSALRDVPVIGQTLRDNIHVHGSGLGLAIGLIGTLYGSLGMAQAGQTVFNRIYSVPRNQRPNPFKSRLRSLRLLPLLGLLVIVTSALSALPTRASIGSLALGFGLHLTALGLSIAVNIVLFVLAFRLLTAEHTPIREVIVGAVVAGIAWQGLQYLGAIYLTDKVAHASEVYGVFALVLGSITWLYLEALIVVICAEINVVLHRRLWPRALLTPFTDDVDLTSADRRAYAGYARAERFKGYEQISVDFDGSDEPDPDDDSDQNRLF